MWVSWRLNDIDKYGDFSSYGASESELSSFDTDKMVNTMVLASWLHLQYLRYMTVFVVHMVSFDKVSNVDRKVYVVLAWQPQP